MSEGSPHVPLTRASVTAASRIMLPTYPILFGAVGLNYLLDARRLNDSPALAYADDLMPLPGWGILFLAAAVIMIIALLRGGRTAYRYALWICMIAATAFALALLGAVIFGGASYTAPLWPAFAARCCWASERSLLTRET